MAWVKAPPPDYQIVYQETQKYLFKVGPIDLVDGVLLPGIIDFFEEGVAAGKGVLETHRRRRRRLLRRPDQGLADVRRRLPGVQK